MPLASEDHILLLGICLCLDLAKGTNQSKIKIRKSEGEGIVGHCICVQSVMINKAFSSNLCPNIQLIDFLLQEEKQQALTEPAGTPGAAGEMSGHLGTGKAAGWLCSWQGRGRSSILDMLGFGYLSKS